MSARYGDFYNFNMVVRGILETPAGSETHLGQLAKSSAGARPSMGASLGRGDQVLPNACGKGALEGAYDQTPVIGLTDAELDEVSSTEPLEEGLVVNGP